MILSYAIQSSNRQSHKTGEPVINLAVVHSETELVHIGLHVLDGDMVVDSIHPTFHDCPERFNAVCMLPVSLRELNLMVHHNADEILGVLNPSFVNDIVPAILVSHNRSTRLADIIQYLQQLLAREFLPVCIGGCHDAVNPARRAFLDTDDGSLGGRATTTFVELFVGLTLKVDVLLAGFATHISLVHLHDCLKAVMVLFLAHNLTDKVQHTPSTLVGFHAEFPLQLTSGDTLLRNHDEVDCVEPHTGIKMGILKDSSAQCREMGLAVVAVQVTTIVSLVAVDVVNTTAERTHISAVVLNLDDKVNGRLLRGEMLMEIKNSHSSSSFLT